MQFSTKTSAPERTRAACVIVPVLARKLIGDAALAFDVAHDKKLSTALKSGDLAAKAGSTMLVALDGPATRALLVSVGEEADVTDKRYRDAVRGAVRHLRTLAAADALSLLHTVAVGTRTLAWKVRAVVAIARDAEYRFDSFKSKPDPTPVELKSIAFAVAAPEVPAVDAELVRAVAISDGIARARDLGNTPPNVCTPTYLAEDAQALGKTFKLKVEVLDVKQMQALGMNALLAVGQGSAQPPKTIIVHYRGGAARKAPVVLVGKGITFDTGGISLKPAAEMDEMKFDMCGAASVLGTMHAIAAMKLKINVIGVIGSAENMPSGNATRPGDIVTTMSGQTVEILNTDAEGRLVLCDVLTYVERFKPAAVVDIATLTGACVIALGAHNSGLFSKNDELADELIAAGREADDTCWRMPLDDAYQEQLKSPFADFANIGGRAAGAVTAACYLSRFTKAYDWAHLDIAGTAWKSGAAKGSTGRPVGLLTRFLIDRADA